MKSSTIFLLFFLLHKIKTNQVPCESVQDGDYSHFYAEPPNTCFMNDSTTIDTRGFIISTANDETVQGLKFTGNEKIFFLPDNVAEKFPNLIFYFADFCSLTEVFKENFQRLDKLRVLLLSNNHIERVYGESFVDLTSLEDLNLGERFFMATSPLIEHVT